MLADVAVQNTGKIVFYAKAFNSQVVKWAVLTHIDSSRQRVNTLLVWKGLQTKYCVMPVPLPSNTVTGIFLLFCLM